MKRTDAGMSLAELLLVICLISITCSIALPAFSQFYQRNKLEALTDQLHGHIAHARALSISSNRDVEVCGSADGLTCISAWRHGWLLRLPAEGTIISHHPLSSSEHLRWAGMSRKIRFQDNGTTSLGNGRFYICDRQGEPQWQLVLNKQGRVRRARGLEKKQKQIKPCG